MQMKREMTLMELQDIFGQRIRKTLNSDGLSKEEKEVEYEQTRLVLDLGKQMINNADIVMRREQLLAKTNNLSTSKIDDIIGE